MKKKTPAKSSTEKAFVKPLPEDFLIVGIGASAGGIQALKEFFENVPADSGLAFVVILHLSPDHDSQLAEVLQTVAAIPVTQVKKRVKVQPNQVYVVPPNEHLTMNDGDIEVSPNVSVEDRRAPVDIFFRTLAESHTTRAVAVILSGTGANGSMGMKRVKERGGACFVQNPREAEFSEMPRNSIATELVDRILNVAEIPAHIIGYQNNLGKVTIPIEAETRPENQQQALREIFTQLRVRTGHDFSNYKRPTILRRIERRIHIRHLEDLPSYVAFVRENPEEATALLKDLLISVTNFFRDKTAFDYLETEILPKIFAGKTSNDQVRLWSVGCATGEEAYSLAMLCAEKTLGIADAPEVQIFATDIDEKAIATARDGFYTLNDAADVSPERLRRFFNKEADGYRVRRELREMVLFANHNALKDPPFSRLDLATCRNMLIYLNRTAQERVMETFHFALNAGGFLFLGNSETTDGAGDLYASLSRENHVYQSRQAAVRIAYPMPDAMSKNFGLGRMPELPLSPLPELEIESRPFKRISLSSLHLQLLEQFAPSVVVNDEYEIIHISESALRFLQLKAGAPTQNLLELIRAELRLELRTALYQAAQKQMNVEVKNLKIETDGRGEIINLTIRPVFQGEILIENDDRKRKISDAPAPSYILVLFETARNSDGAETGQTVFSSAEPIANQLEEELVRSKSQLRAAVEQYEVQAEELKASNEELQAMNEEMRSAAEELETGKEELQSVNEELVTVNQELKIKIEELGQSNNDFQNLINSTDIATIFLDRSFRVNTFTPAATRIFNLIAADTGRPLSDITHRLEDGNLLRDAETVLDTLQSIEREVASTDKRFFLLRVLPYRTAEDRINGIVLTFTDITERRKAEESRTYLASIVESSEDSIIAVDLDGIITSWNKAAENLYGYPAREAVGKSLTMLILPEDLAEILGKADKIKRSQKVEIYDSVRVHKDGRQMNLEIVLSPVKDEKEKIIGVSTVARDVTKRREAEENSRESEKRLRTLIKSLPGGAVFVLDENLRYLIAEGEALTKAGFKPEDLVGKTIFEALPPELAKSYEPRFQKAFAGETFEHEHEAHNHFYLSRGVPLRSETGEIYAVLAISYDITTRRIAEEALRESDERLRLAVEAGELGTWEWHLKTDEVFWNERHFHLLGLEPQPNPLKAEMFFNHIHPNDHDSVGELLQQAIRDKAIFDADFRSIHESGETRWMSGYGRVTAESEDGAPLKMSGVMFDINDRKRAEEALRESEERLRLLIESAADYAIFTTTNDGVINAWNKGAEKIFGWTEKEILGELVEIIFTPEDRLKKMAEKEMKTALRIGRSPDERFHLRKDGSRFYVSGVMTLLKDAGGNVCGFVKIARDMSETLEAEKTARDREMLQKLVGAQEMERKRIARDLHDELGQQLTALRLKLDKTRMMCDDDEICAAIDEIEQLAKSIDNGVDFLAWELRPAALDQFGLIPALENYVKQWSHHSGISAELLASSLKRKRFTSEVETNLYRIVQEALNNIHKHAKAKSVDVLLEKRDDLIVLIVQDDGRGFNPKNKKERLKGIGLIGMKERAALIKGIFEVESAPGKGTTVFVRVPVAAIKKGDSDGK